MARWFTIALGVLGWGVVLGLPAAGVLSQPEFTAGLWIALFLIVILAARALAFRIEGSVLSLDSAYYVAAALCVGAVGAARLVGVALTLDAAARLYVKRAHERWMDELGYVLYFGGMSGGLVVLLAWVVGATHGIASEAESSVLAVTGRVVVMGVLLLLCHYALQGVRHQLLGQPWRTYLVDVAVPGMAAEATLMPIGVVLVLLYDPGQPLGFCLLSFTYLLINFVFSRLSRTQKQLRERVHDLEILNLTGRRLSASLQLGELVEQVARETCKAIPEAEAIALVHRRAGGELGFVLDGYDRATDRFFRQPLADITDGATGSVMHKGIARRIDDLENSDVSLGEGTQGIRSWLGVPLFMYGGCEGVIAVQSSRPRAFREDHQHLLQSLGLQIAAALQNAHLYELAMVDGLTGLFMRRYFDARIDEEIERSKRYQTPFSVVMIDVDDFKKLNDEHGHLIGDRVLRTIADVVKGQMRGVDTAARYGGEEIALILPRTEMVAAYNVGERIRAAIADERVTTDSEPPKVLGVTASFGIASYPESKAKDGEDLVRRADRALYRAKKTGKNRVELFWSDESGPIRMQMLGGE